MANFGIGLGAFMNGLTGGMQAYQQIQESKDRKKLRDIQFKQLEQDATDKQELRDTTRASADAARAARQADITGMIKPGETVGPDGVAKPAFSVGGKNYNTQEEAAAAADKQVGSFMDYYMKTSVPKMQEHWMKTGQVEKAQALGKWMEDENVKKGAKAWAGAVRAFQTGDREGFKTNLMAAYNQQGYFDDGMEATKIEDVKNDQGQLTGYAITFRDGQGKETTQNYDGDDVAKLGLNALSPTEVLSYGLEQVKAANAARSELAKEGRGFQRDLTKLGVQQQNTLEAQNNAAQLRAADEAEKRRTGGDSTKVREANAISGALKARGYDEKYINSVYPQLLGVERGSKSTTDRLDGYIAALAKNDLDFAGLPVSLQVQKAQEMMAEVDKARGGETATPGSSQSGATPNFGQKAKGMLQQGNIDLNSRPRVKNTDGSISTVRSMSVNFDGKEYLIPTVAEDGTKILSDDDAIKQFQRTGKHLGVFDNPSDATAYAESLHNDQAAQYVGAGNTAPVQSGKGVPFWDSKTNTLIYR